MNASSNKRLAGKIRMAACRVLVCVVALPVLRSYPQAATEPDRTALQATGSSLTPPTRPRIGLALEGGGALGIAHIGALLWMRQHRIPVDQLAGTSMGALIGSLIASGHTPEEIERLATDTDFDELFTLQPLMSDLDFRRREDRNDLPQAISIGLRHGTPSLGNAIIADGRLNAFLGREMAAYNSENLDFNALPIPFRCVATNLTTLRPAVFRDGSLPFAVRASISIPGIFPPVARGNDLLVDGGIVDNLPIDVLRDELHAQVVISVYLGDSPFAERDGTTLLGILGRAVSAGVSRNVELSRSRADIEIAPNLDPYTVTDYKKAKSLIKLGYDAAEKQRDKLLPLALSPEDWDAYEAGLAAKRRRRPDHIDATRVSGPDPAVSAHLESLAKRLEHRPYRVQEAENVVSTVRGDGALDAFYETFRSSEGKASAGNSALPDDGIKIFWNRKTDGPPYLLLGAEVVASTSNVTSSIFDLRFVDQNFGGYGSELRSTLRVGYLTQAAAEYYRPLANSHLFVQPKVDVLREPIYIWDDQKRVSERFLQRAGGGLDFGMAFKPNLQASVEYRASDIRWKLVSGADQSPTPHLSGRVQSAAARFVYTTRTAAIAAPHGSLVDFTVGHFFDTTVQADVPFARLNARQSFSFAHVNLISISTEVSTYFRNYVPDPLRFTLGGPLRLYASSIDEYRGTDSELVRGVYLRRIASLPTGIGQGVYLSGGYEQGDVWSPEHQVIFRQDGVGGILFSTPLGAITLGGAVGNQDHRKMFFTFGKLF